jgi:hypothetical protein
MSGRTKVSKKEYLKLLNAKKKYRSNGNPYDLNRLGMGFNQPCPRCGLQIDRRASPYEPVGFIKYCMCKRR